MTGEERMKLYRRFFPDDTMIDTPKVIDSEYLSGTFDEWLTDNRRCPEEIGVSPQAIAQRKKEEKSKKPSLPFSYDPEAAAKAERERTSQLSGEVDPSEYVPGGFMIAPQAISVVVTEIMRPVMESIGKLLKNNTEAMEQIAASQDVIRNRMEALEKQVRLNTPVTDKQARYLVVKARDKARELLEKKESGLSEDKKAVTKLAGLIKKDVMMRNGVGSLREIPRCEYSVTMSQIEIWNNALALFDIVKEARKRKEAEATKDAE